MSCVSDIKHQWSAFWQKKNHVLVAPVSLVASSEDKTALFNVAGMQQLVPYLSGQDHPNGKRLYNIQKCLRTNDIEDIGDERHLSLFEMMGNWSLGDYFKKESLTRSVEFLVDVLGLDKDRLGCSVFGGYVDSSGQEVIPYDRQAEEILLSLGIAPERIKAIAMIEGEKCDNFWGPAGSVGPCGPCAEFHYDRGDDRGPNDWDIGVNDRFIEIWNNVFMEFYKREDGSFEKLSQQNVDTGMGLERLAMLLQDKETIFETDVFADYVTLIEGFSNVPYPPYTTKQSSMTDKQFATTRSYRIILDHMRSAIFLISDGVLPSNDARGYVLRRLIRRMALHLCIQLTDRHDIDDLISAMVALVIHKHSDTYASIQSLNATETATVIVDEVAQFLSTVDKGRQKLTSLIQKTSGSVLSGDDVFLLYDTFGFPVELTQELAQDEGYDVDMDGFVVSMERAKAKARAGSSDAFVQGVDRAQYLDGVPVTEFVGYDQRSIIDPIVIKQVILDDGRLVMIFDKTPFYAESGGQTADRGVIELDDGTTKEIVDVKQYNGVYLHFVR